jgi:hypothetical protein
MEAMEPIDVDDIIEVSFPEATPPGEAESVEVVFKNGTRKRFSGEDLRAVLPILNHWTPPTA